MSGPLPAVVAVTYTDCRSVEIVCTETLTPLSCPKVFASFCSTGARCPSAQITRSAEPRAGTPEPELDGAGLVELAPVEVAPELGPPEDLSLLQAAARRATASAVAAAWTWNGTDRRMTPSCGSSTSGRVIGQSSARWKVYQNLAALARS